MFKLTGASLPSSPSSPARAVPIFRVYNTAKRPLPTLFKVRGRASLVFEDDIDVPMPPVADSGVYAIAPLPFTINKILSISTGSETLTAIADPLKAATFTTWQSGGSLHSFLPRDLCTPGVDMTMRAIAQARLPIPDSYSNFLLDLSTWTGAAPELMWSNGMLFRPASNPSVPKNGDFVDQGGGIYKLFAQAGTAPPAFSVLDITLSAVVHFEAESTFAIFDFTQSRLDTLEAIDYLGKHFKPSADKFHPRIGDLFWLKPRAVLFLDLATTIKPVAINAIAQSSISSFTYNS